MALAPGLRFIIFCHTVWTLVSLAGARESPQSVLSGHASDPHAEGRDRTGHLVFQSLLSLMQMQANSRHPNGHSIVRATIPVGTLLYHGQWTSDPPTQDWIAFDAEHAFLFTGGDDGTLFTYITTRELNLVYFDGASGNKLRGVADTQDILFYGEVREGNFENDVLRLRDGCKWGEPYGVDGYVRMEFDFEIMYCHISDGLELVSATSTLRRPLTMLQPHSGSEIDPLPGTRPEGWKGSVPDGGMFYATQAGTRHNFAPGDLRVRVHPGAMLSFFDPAFESLVDGRRGVARDDYRLANISEEDIDRARRDFVQALERPLYERSGVDWQALAQVLTERFSDHLKYLQYILHTPSPDPYSIPTPPTNSSTRAALARSQVAALLLPYMPHDGVPDLRTWLTRVSAACSTSATSHLPVSHMTKQERTLLHATQEVLDETCGVLTDIWAEAFDVEEQTLEVASLRLERWKMRIDRLVEWLDWPVWVKCVPACPPDEFCLLRQSRIGHRDKIPRCFPLDGSFDENEPWLV